LARVAEDQLEDLAFQDPGIAFGDLVTVRLLKMAGPHQAWVQGPNPKPFLCDLPQKINEGQTLVVRIKTPPMAPKPGRCNFERMGEHSETPGMIIYQAPRPLDLFLNKYSADLWITNDESLLDLRPGTTLKSNFNSCDFIAQWIEPLVAGPLSLPGGGSAIIEVGETLTAIDVNTKSSETAGLDGFLGPDMENLFAFNQRILPALAKAIGLYKLGGIVLIDLPRVSNVQDREELKRQMRHLTRGTGTQVLGFTKSGLLELLVPRREMDIFKRFR